MASSKELAPLLPETLPEDFNEWDGKAAAAPSPVKSGERDAWEATDSFGETQKPLWQSGDRDAFLASLVDGPRVSGSAASAPVFLKQQEDVIDWDSEGTPAPWPVDRTEWDTWEGAHSFEKSPKPAGQSADREAFRSPVVDRPHDSGSAASAPVFLKQQEDVIDWDSEGTPAPWPVDRTEWDTWEGAHSFEKSPKPAGQSADREAFRSPVVERPHDSGSAASAPVVVKQQELTNELVDGSPSNASHKPEAGPTTNEAPVAAGLPNVAAIDGVQTSTEPTATTRRKADEAVFQLFSTKSVEVKVEQKSAKKKWMIVAGISAGSILLPLILMTPLFHFGSKSAAKHAVQPLPGAGETQPNANTPDLPASKPPAQGKPLATTGKQQTTDDQPSGEEEGTTPAQVQSTMMNDQLTAPTRIPKQETENAPPPANSDTASADGLGGGANVSPFNGHSQPTVKVTPAKPVAISSGVATGMLIQKTPPVYPPIAKTAHVAGTVEVHATISTNGTIKDLHAASGPVMLRQAALDAVRTWRYKPYRLNNEPVEVETTINVVFSLGG